MIVEFDCGDAVNVVRRKGHRVKLFYRKPRVTPKFYKVINYPVVNVSIQLKRYMIKLLHNYVSLGTYPKGLNDKILIVDRTILIGVTALSVNDPYVTLGFLTTCTLTVYVFIQPSLVRLWRF